MGLRCGEGVEGWAERWGGCGGVGLRGGEGVEGWG